MLSLRILLASVLLVLHSVVNAYNHFHGNKLFTNKALTTANLMQDSSAFRKRIREQEDKRKKSVVSLNLMEGLVEGLSEAFVGGTVGVMSVMILLEVKKKEDAGLESCPYCMGNGEILCATCCGCTSDLKNNGPCPTCGGRGLVLCINCKGDGRITPILLQSKSTRNPEFAADKVSIDGP
jgi:DnaJ-class molecular chaperone